MVEGTIVDVKMGKSGDPYATVYVDCKKIEVGDKIATSHDLKFTIRDRVSLKDMLRIRNQITDEMLIPNLLLSTKNLTWGLGGTIRDMSATTNLFKSTHSFRTWSGHKPTKVVSFEDQMRVEPKLPVDLLSVDGIELRIRDKYADMRKTKGTCGI